MAAEDFDSVEANSGTGGALFAMDTFTDASGDSRVMPFSAIVLPEGSGYSRVGASNPMPVTGPLTDTQLRATALPVSGTFYQATQPISAAALPLPSGAATDANQVLVIAGLTTLAGYLDGVEALLAAPVLPPDAATATNQATEIASLASIDTSTGRIAGKYVDFDTGAGTDSVVAVGILLPGAGGAVIGGTSTNPIRFDPTGTTAQPVNIVSGQTGITAGAGAVAANTPRITHASDDPVTASLNVMDDWDETDRCKVNLIAGQVGVDGNSGLKSAATVRVVMATDQPTLTNPQPANISQVAGSAIAQGHGTAAAAIRVELPTDGTGVVGLAAGSQIVGKFGIDQTTPGTTNLVQGAELLVDDAAFTPATSKVSPIGLQCDEAATDSVDEGDVGCPRMTPDRKQIVTDLPHTAGGLTTHKTVSAASTNATAVKASAGQLYEIMCSNVNAAARYLKLYNKATAPTVGTDTPVWTLIIPGNTAGGGIAKSIPKGLEFSTGIAFALTTEATDAGTTGVAASELVVNLGYK